MDKAEFLMALLQCINWDPYDGSNCDGCPLMNEEHCRYLLRTEVANYFINEKPSEERVVLGIPLDKSEE